MVRPVEGAQPSLVIHGGGLFSRCATTLKNLVTKITDLIGDFFRWIFPSLFRQNECSSPKSGYEAESDDGEPVFSEDDLLCLARAPSVDLDDPDLLDDSDLTEVAAQMSPEEKADLEALLGEVSDGVSSDQNSPKE